MRRARASLLLDAFGRPLPRASVSSAYEGGGGGRRFAGFYAPNIGFNAALLGNLEQMRARSRALLRSHPLVWKGFRSLVANVVGTGIKPRSRLTPVALRTQAHAVWDTWTNKADADGRTDFYGVQTLALQEVLVAGEVFARLRSRRPEDGMAVPLQIQLLQGDQVPVWKNEVLASGNRVRAGIEFNAIGQRVAYWMYRDHPNDAIGFRAASDLELVRVPAEDVLHVYQVVAPGQLRGEPLMARIILRAHDKDVSDDAQLTLQKMAALLCGFIKKASDDTSPLDEVTDGGETDPVFESGTLVELNDGEEITFPTLPSMGTGYADMQRKLDRDLAGGLGVAYEQLTGDYSQTNYSSARAALLDFRRVAEQTIHHTLCPTFNQPIWQRWLSTAVLAGALTIPGFANDPETASSVDWRPQGWPAVDLLKEMQGHRMAVRSGFRSRSSVIAEVFGEDAEVVDAQIAEDNARADQLGLVFDTDPRKVADNGSAVAPAEPDPAIDEPPQAPRRAAGGARG